MMPPARPTYNEGRMQPSDIVLLEEADLHRFNQPGQALHETTTDYQAQLAASTCSGSPPPPVKYARSTYSHRSNPYTHASTPFGRGSKRTAWIDTIPAHYGVLRGGGPVNLFSRDYVGLLLNWMLVGTFNGALPGIIYPLFSAYLNFTDTQVSATYSLFNFGWYFKWLLGFVTDNYPINRQRRKPYIFIGWTTLAGFMIAMACMNKVEPYEKDGEIVNEAAPSQGGRYVVPIVISSFAYLMSNVACEGMMVEFAHREGEYDRGRTQLWCVIFRFIGEILGGLFPALGFNSAMYGGSFTSAVPMEWFFVTLAVIALVGNVLTYFFLKDDQVPTTRQGFASSLRRVWRFLEQRATTQVMVACFIITVGSGLTVVESYEMFDEWMPTDSLVTTVVGVSYTLCYIIAAASMHQWLLNTNWRGMVVACFIIASIIQFPVEMMTVWDVVRSSELFVTKDSISMIFESIVWLLSLLVIVEVAEPGLESTSYGLITTVCNLGGVVVSSSYNIASAGWSEESTDIAADTSAVRWHLTYEHIFKHVGRTLLMVLAVAILPRQKRHVKEIKVRGAPNLAIPIVLLAIVSCLFLAAITSAILAMFESTSCLRFAGGSGCEQE